MHFPAQYLALYDVYDAKWFTQEHIDRARTPYMIIEDSLDMSRLDDFFYYPLAYRDKKPRAFAECGVVLEQMQAKPGEEAAFREWFCRRIYACALPAGGNRDRILPRLRGIRPDDALRPAHNHVAIWRLEDEGARRLWRESNPLADCPYLETEKTAISCWDIASNRLIKDDVTYPDAQALAREEAARARIKAQGSVFTTDKQRIKSASD